MESIRSESADDDDRRFRYQPLASPDPIRLVEVDSELSTDGTLQLQLYESALSEDYSCLSYVWGKADDCGGPFRILLNGKDFYTAFNLTIFLYVARAKYPKRRIWIDAICINQNDMSERNQQVQQMGQIYSGAKDVIAWLGHDETAAASIPLVSGRARHPYRHLLADFGDALLFFARTIGPSGWFGLSLTPQRSIQKYAFEQAIFTYWKRAWITQEIMLAKNVRLLLHETELDLTALEVVKKWNYSLGFCFWFLELYEASARDCNNHDQHLLTLLNKYGGKRCEIKRDRIYSLLPMCVEGTDLRVDYDLPEEELLRTVLRISRLTLCLCSVLVVTESINVDAIPKKDLKARYFVKFTVPATDVHTYQATRRKWRSCCPWFSAISFAERSNGQLFCLSNVCPHIKWHLFVESQEPGKQRVKGVKCKGLFKDTISISLGKNGKQIDIHASSPGDSYTVNLTLGTLLKLSTDGDAPIVEIWSSLLKGKDDSDKWRGLCNVAMQTEGNSRVEFLDLGP